MDTAWKQVTIDYPGRSRHEREHNAVPHLRSVLPAAETVGLITAWWFIRKGPWRIRYLPTTPTDHPDPLHRLLTQNVPWIHDIYEPETHTFGGPAAMDTAHTLFHHDSHHLLTYLHDRPTNRREHSLILTTALMRAAGLDLNEQADVWASAAQHRPDHPHPATRTNPVTWTSFTDKIRHLLLGNPHHPCDWHTAFADAGTTLGGLRATGTLTRGLRAVITEHVIFHWNRIGLPATTQATLAHAATEAILGSTLPPPTYGQTASRTRHSAHGWPRSAQQT
ncbi:MULTISPECIES: thiopeptide-type bacteriocin biosynthesis protein [unclassified Micromonospora]|uniref:thiopeptide-type bacteriocin biosynthesis protein n=1 Tax=unclassified Micromonospora TaxID=2617518 RepID=UPI003A8918FB